MPLTPSESWSYRTPWGCMLNGKCALFLKTILSVSPASPLSTGPTIPRCAHSGPCVFSTVKEASVHCFFEDSADVPGVILYENAGPLVVGLARHMVHLGRCVVPIHLIGRYVVGTSRSGLGSACHSHCLAGRDRKQPSGGHPQNS